MTSRFTRVTCFTRSIQRLEPKGPGAGYGVKKAATGAQQHLDLAAKAEGATATLTV